MHYTSPNDQLADSHVQTVDMMRTGMTSEQYAGYLGGNVVKYWWRSNHPTRNAEQKLSDAKKMAHYAQLYQEFLEYALEDVLDG